jgi:hypothetical protein
MMTNEHTKASHDLLTVLEVSVEEFEALMKWVRGIQ